MWINLQYVNKTISEIDLFFLVIPLYDEAAPSDQCGSVLFWDLWCTVLYLPKLKLSVTFSLKSQGKLTLYFWKGMEEAKLKKYTNI